MTDETAESGAAESADGDGESADGDGESADGDGGTTYGGLVGAFPYAFRTSESRLFRSYAVLGGLLTAVVVALFALAIVTLIGGTGDVSGGTFTFSRTFFVFLMLLVVAPLVGPVLAVARRHRREGSPVGYDRAMAATGYGFLASLYVMLVVTVPPVQQDPPTGALGPVVGFLYDLPVVAGVTPPLLAAAVMLVIYRRRD